MSKKHPMMTREEMRSTPDERKYYVCQTCGKSSTDKEEFKMMVIFRIGYIVCKGCLIE